jgi:cephalosporin-C deacetylase-like acetyl esterase
MKRNLISALILIAVFAASRALATAPGTTIPTEPLFDYEKSQPLLDKVTLMEDRPQVRRYRVEYTSTNGLVVPGYYYVPKKGDGPFPVVMFMHGAGGSKDDLVIGYEFLAMRGFAVLAIDAALHGERSVPNIEAYKVDWYQTRELFRQTVIDLRRGVDWLLTRPEIDPERIGFFGASQGSIIGVTFVAVEPRVKAAVFLIGGADFHILFRHSQLPALNIMRNYLTDEELDKIADDLAVVDPQYYIGAIAPRPVMLMNGKKDYIISPEAGARLQELAGEPKETYWYDGPHIPPFDKALVLSAKFFKKHLGKGRPAPPKPAPTAEKPAITFGVTRDFSDPFNRIVEIEAKTEKPLPRDGSLAVWMPGITPQNLPLFDDGTHGDAKAGDGNWTMKFTLGPRAPDLDAVGGDAMYTMYLRALDADGALLSQIDAGILTVDEKEKPK